VFLFPISRVFFCALVSLVVEFGLILDMGAGLNQNAMMILD
jgi:hypothetical protein